MKFTGWVKSTGNNVLKASLNVTGVPETWIETLIPPSGEWQYFEVIKTVDEDNTTLDANVFVTSDPDAVLYVDDVTIALVDEYLSEAFESADLRVWDNQVLWVGGGASLEVSTEEAHSGNSSLKVYGGYEHQSSRRTISGFNSGDIVKFTGWVKSTGSKALKASINVTGVPETWIETLITPSGDWQYFEVIKTVDEDNTTLDANVFVTSDPDTVLYVDDVTVEVLQ